MQIFRFTAAAGIFAFVALPVFAQFRADHKITGEAFRGHQARTYQRHARDYSQMLYYAGRCEQPLNTQVAKEQAAGVRKNVVAANKALDEVKAAHAAKPEVAKAIDKIKERHAKVIVKCDELDAHLAKADKDTTVICECCMDALDELDAASAETDKLLKDLKLDEPPKPARSGKPGKDAPKNK